MSLAQLPQASSSRTIREKASAPTEILAPVVLQYEKYQDTMPVNSNEENEHATTITGVKHYRHMHNQRGLFSKPTLDHIDHAALSRLQSSTRTPSPPPTPAQDALPAAPSPPSSAASYTSSTYTGTTCNPAVFLAILQIARLDLPTLNLISALNHIPNIGPTDAVPVLRPAAPENLAPQPFLETQMPWTARDSDEDMGIAFLPHFYDGGARHALGYFSIVQCPLRGRVLGTAFFTPCVEEDLRRFGLVEYVGSLEGVEAMGWVGCVNGKWLERDTVEDYAEWKLVFRIASVTWEGRMGLLRGELEGS